MAKYRLKSKVTLRPEIKEKLENKKEAAFSTENLTKVGALVTIGSGLAGIALKGIKISNEIKK